MLDMDIEPRYGILFVRLSGTLNKKNYKSLSSVDFLLKQVGIRNVVFNIQNLKKTGDGKNTSLNNCNKCNSGSILICAKDNDEITEKISFLLDKIGIVEDELTTLRKINL